MSTSLRMVFTLPCPNSIYHCKISLWVDHFPSLTIVFSFYERSTQRGHPREVPIHLWHCLFQIVSQGLYTGVSLLLRINYFLLHPVLINVINSKKSGPKTWFYGKITEWLRSRTLGSIGHGFDFLHQTSLEVSGKLHITGLYIYLRKGASVLKLGGFRFLFCFIGVGSLCEGKGVG